MGAILNVLKIVVQVVWVIPSLIDGVKLIYSKLKGKKADGNTNNNP
jgi:hypothetical protein